LRSVEQEELTGLSLWLFHAVISIFQAPTIDSKVIRAPV
jgi:hypothetical protein